MWTKSGKAGHFSQFLKRRVELEKCNKVFICGIYSISVIVDEKSGIYKS